MIPLSADLVARAVIASARSYGDDPVAACTAKRGVLRRPLKGAALGLHRALGGDLCRYCKVLGISEKNVYHAKHAASAEDPFWAAADSAELTVLFYRGADTPKDPPRPNQTHTDRLANAVRDIEPWLERIFAAHPGGATAANVAALTGLSVGDVAKALARLYAEHKCRWRKAPGSGRFKVVTPWSDQPTLPKAVQHRGRISSVIAPSLSRREVPQQFGLRDRILAQLRDAPSTAPSLAILTDAKELAVSEMLRGMEREGVVMARPVPPQGARYREWAIPKETVGIGPGALKQEQAT